MFGVLVDVSGSMQSAYALNSSSDTSIERVHAIFTSILNIVKSEITRRNRLDEIFITAFGLQASVSTCDLIALLDIIASPRGMRCDEVYDALVGLAKQNRAAHAERWIREHLSEKQARELYRVLCLDESLVLPLVQKLPPKVTRSQRMLAGLSKNVPGGKAVEGFAVHRSEAFLHAEKLIVDTYEIISRAVLPNIEHPVPKSVQYVAQLLDDLNLREDSSQASSSSSLHTQIRDLVDPIKPYIYGGTPMRKAMREALTVFRESRAESKVLFILSDGESGDGDPRGIARELKSLGVTIVTCYLTDKHIDNERCLLHHGTLDQAKKFNEFDPGVSLRWLLHQVQELRSSLRRASRLMRLSRIPPLSFHLMPVNELRYWFDYDDRSMWFVANYETVCHQLRSFYLLYDPYSDDADDAWCSFLLCLDQKYDLSSMLEQASSLLSLLDQASKSRSLSLFNLDCKLRSLLDQADSLKSLLDQAYSQQSSFTKFPNLATILRFSDHRRLLREHLLTGYEIDSQLLSCLIQIDALMFLCEQPSLSDEQIDIVTSLLAFPVLNLERGDVTLFEMSSTMRNIDPPVSYLVDAGWTLPASGECQLFIEANSLDVVDELCKTVVSQLTNPCDGLVDVLEKVPLANYINQSNTDFQPKQQIGGTCYANAVAAVFHLAMHRIVGREGGYPDFFEIRDRLIQEYGKEGAVTKHVLEKVCPEYRLHFREVNEIHARQALNHRRPLVTTCFLHNEQWKKFFEFFGTTPQGILQRADIGEGSTKPGAHAVVLIRCNPQCLVFMNSWGQSWADGGFFRVKDAQILNDVKFYDVYWEESDLTPGEREAYRREGIERAKELAEQFPSVSELLFECPICRRTSRVGDFDGDFLEATCPKCGCKFKPTNEDLVKSLYLRNM